MNIQYESTTYTRPGVFKLFDTKDPPKYDETFWGTTYMKKASLYICMYKDFWLNLFH